MTEHTALMATQTPKAGTAEATTETNDGREWLLDLLPKSAHKHIDAILRKFTPEVVHEVEVVGARVQIEQVEAYGLSIGLDANGNAVTVGFPYGAEVTA